MTFSILIPARKGSKSIKNKNVRMVKGKPLAEYTFKSLKDINIKKFVLTGDIILKKIANRYKINTEYPRPKSLALDDTSLVNTILHFLKWAELNDFNEISTLVILQLTSPLRTADHIKKAINYYKKKKLTSLFSISESSEHPYETIDLKKGGKWKLNFAESKKFFRRQDYKLNSYFINGAIYIVDKKYFLKKKKFVSNNHGLFKMKKIESIDIDDIDDIKIAESLL